MKFLYLVLLFFSINTFAFDNSSAENLKASINNKDYISWESLRKELNAEDIIEYVGKNNLPINTNLPIETFNPLWTKLLDHSQYYEKLSQEYCIIYFIMANILTRYHILPKIYYDQNNQLLEQNALQQLVNPIKDQLEVIANTAPIKQLRRWAKRFHALILMYKSTNFSTIENSSDNLEKAYNIIIELVQKNKGKTNLLFLADILENYRYRPANMTEEQVQTALEELSEITQKIKPPIFDRPRDQSFPEPSVLRILVRHDSVFLSEQSRENETFLPAAQFTVGFINDYANIPANLTFYNKTFYGNSRHEQWWHHGDKTFKKTNVSGANLNCFFNSAGFERIASAETLISNLDNENVRSMIANEIILLAFESVTQNIFNQPRFSERLKKLIGFQEYHSRQRHIDKLRSQNNQKRQAENVDWQLLNEEADRLNNLEEEAKFELFKRASQPRACEQYILDEILPNGRFMNIQPNLDNNIKDFTAIDAIAYLNNTGLIVYKKSENEKDIHKNILVKYHVFVPENAQKIAHIFHSGAHFQFLQIEDQPHDDLNNNNFPSFYSDEIDFTSPSFKPIRRSYHPYYDVFAPTTLAKSKVATQISLKPNLKIKHEKDAFLDNREKDNRFLHIILPYWHLVVKGMLKISDIVIVANMSGINSKSITAHTVKKFLKKESLNKNKKVWTAEELKGLYRQGTVSFYDLRYRTGLSFRQLLDTMSALNSSELSELFKPKYDQLDGFTQFQQKLTTLINNAKQY